jgi:hypothetical protein
MKALFVLPQIATLFALYLFQDILSPLKLFLFSNPAGITRTLGLDGLNLTQPG